VDNFNPTEIEANRLRYSVSETELGAVSMRHLLVLSFLLSGTGAETDLHARSALADNIDEARRQYAGFQREIAKTGHTLGAAEIERRRRDLAIIDLSDLESLASLIRRLDDLQCLALLTRIEQVHAIASGNGGSLEPAARWVYAAMNATLST
jgi:hypothetical protein